jgi:hypothetical protein
VLSVYQSDVSSCDIDVFAYAEREIGHVKADPSQPPTPTVDFWSDLIG